MKEYKLSRREFLKKILNYGAVALGSEIFLSSSLNNWLRSLEAEERPELAIAHEGRPEDLVKRAIAGLGGMERYVKKGNTVVIKPNISWARTPEQAATTNPQVVKTLVEMCFQAGAKKVIVLDHTINDYRITLDRSGIREVAEKAKAIVLAANRRDMYKEVTLPGGKILQQVAIAKEILLSEVLINVPIAKVHGSTRLTLGLKNLMGIVWDRGYFHYTDLDQCIADLSTLIRPQLVVLDAIRILKTNGPSGPGETEMKNRIIAATDPVAIDSYGASLFGMQGENIEHIRRAYELGLGEINLGRVNLKQV